MQDAVAEGEYGIGDRETRLGQVRNKKTRDNAGSLKLYKFV